MTFNGCDGVNWSQISNSEWSGSHSNGGKEDWWYRTTDGETAYHTAACGNLFQSHANGEEDYYAKNCAYASSSDWIDHVHTDSSFSG
jgi:hypothetical protein